MGGEKGSKAGGFFNLFDWNRKSRKKLFSTVSPEGTKQRKRSDDTRLHLIKEDVLFGISSPKGSCDYSCASSVTDEEAYGARAPGVVARLMGLDSMPSSSVSDPYSTPFFDSSSHRDTCTQKRSPDLYMNDKFDHVPVRADSYFRKPVNPRPQKMPSSPIERFQTEVLPPRLAKPLPMTYHKLLSPISAKNAAEIMEAAAKFIEPGLHTPSSSKDKSSFGTSRIPLKVRDPKEIKGIQQRTSRLLQLTRTADLHDVQFSGGQPLNTSWKSTEDIVIFRPSPEPCGCNSAEARAQGKSISLAVQAKVNVQRREGIVTSRNNILVQKEHEECKTNQSFRSQLSIPKNKHQKKPSSANLSGVLRQNNQKQNCSSSKGKLGSKQSMPTQHGRKGHSGDASSLKHMSGSSKVGSRKQVSQTSCLEREGSSSSNRDFPQKKRLTERGFNTMKSTLVKNVPVSRLDTQVQHNAAIDEHKRWDKNNDTSDIISFTFTSPLIKSVNGMPTTNEVGDNCDKVKKYNFDGSDQKVSSDVRWKDPSSGLDVLSGDSLSHLLERKLRELTSVMEPSRNFIKGVNFSTFESCSPVQLDSKSSPDNPQIVPAKHVFPFTSCEDRLSCTSSSDISSINGQMHGVTTMRQVPEEAEHSMISDAHMGLNQKQLSPLSILEVSSNNENWQSSESSESTNGSNFCASSAQAQNVLSLASLKVPSAEIDFQLSDSASSKLMDTSASSESSMTHVGDACQMKSNTEDVEHVREILHNRGLAYSRCLSSYYLNNGKGDSGLLNFERSVCKTNKDAQELKDKGNMARRRMLFDCVQECLNLKCDLYFRAGYEAWAKGMTLIRTDLSEEFCQEISVWKSMKDWMVDDLVDNDMSTNLGKWVNFQVEAFETGKEIQEEILGYLIDEVLADFRVKNKE